jgi:hypothetical protein
MVSSGMSCRSACMAASAPKARTIRSSFSACFFACVKHAVEKNEKTNRRVCVFLTVVITSEAVSTWRGKDMNQLPKKWTPMHFARWKTQPLALAPIDEEEAEEERSPRSIPTLSPSAAALAPRLLRSSASVELDGRSYKTLETRQEQTPNSYLASAPGACA